jgi:hypothetical protein
MAKHTGVDPFNLPEGVRTVAPGAAKTRWADEQLGDVPTCFLSDADTTGGNSGSPVLNGRGELVGINFDRVWENIAGDFAYSTERSRNVSVDVRFMLFLLDEVEHATELLAELGVSKAERAPVVETATASKPTKSRGCACTHAQVESGVPWLGILGVIFMRRLRFARPWRCRSDRSPPAG